MGAPPASTPPLGELTRGRRNAGEVEEAGVLTRRNSAEVGEGCRAPA